MMMIYCWLFELKYIKHISEYVKYNDKCICHVAICIGVILLRINRLLRNCDTAAI